MSQLMASGIPASSSFAISADALSSQPVEEDRGDDHDAEDDLLNIAVDAQKIHAIFNHRCASMLLDESSLRYDGPK
jgi:hypothetical protein